MFDVNSSVSVFVQSAINLLAAVLPHVWPVIAGAVGLWIASRWNDFRVSQPEYIQKLIDEAAEFGADFAEKVGPALEAYGRDKLHLAVEAAEKLLAVKGLEVELDLLEAAIEVVLFRNPDKYPSNRAQG